VREVSMGGKTINLVGAVATQWIYDEHFGTSMQGDYERLLAAKKGESVYYDAVAKMAWAMARTACFPSPFPDYRIWLVAVEWDGSEDQVVKAVIFEATKALFPGKAALVASVEQQLDAEFALGEQAAAGVFGDRQEGGSESGGAGDADASGLR
jgi:hypothetical protein